MKERQWELQQRAAQVREQWGRESPSLEGNTEREREIEVVRERIYRKI